MYQMICFLRGLWWSWKTAAPVSGHDFVEVESSPKRHVLRCETCGHESIGWRR